MNTNTIYCTSIDQFLNVVAGLVQRGIVFTADAEKMSVFCTGGF